MILNICYNDKCENLVKEIQIFCEKHISSIQLMSFSEDDFHQKKKSYKIKGGYSARMTPFALLTDNDNKYIKAFYSEAKECTVENIIKFLKKYESTNN